MTQPQHPRPHLNWAQLFRVEMTWRRRVLAEVASRETAPSSSLKKMRSVIRKGVLATFLPSAWRSSPSAYVFVSFGRNPLVAQTRAHCDVPVFSPEAKARNILRGDSLCELDALYFLLHNKEVYPRWLSKWFIGRLMRWLTRHLPDLQRHAFITHHDYFDKSSVLLSVSSLVPLQIIGLQHGLLRHDYLRRSPTFPGMRNRQHAVYSPLYAELMRMRNPSTECHVLGPPFDLSVNQPTAPTAEAATSGTPARPTLLFVSSDDLRLPCKRPTIEALYKLCQDNGVDFFVRPHPQERHLMATTPLPFAVDSKEEVFSRDPGLQVLAGHFSTFLYEAALRGFRTAWITTADITDARADLPEAVDMPNATVHTPAELDAVWLKSLFGDRPQAVRTPPVGLRMANLLAEAFPNIEPETTA
jgi:hypothetical protein